MRSKVFAAALSPLLTMCPAAIADSAEQALALELANPVADLMSFPIQFNYDGNIGPADKGERLTVNVQPVIPVSLNEDWTVISRTIVPIIWQNDVFTGTSGFDETTTATGPFLFSLSERDMSPRSGSQFGLGDTVQSLFLAPKPVPIGQESSLILGAGPVLLLPTGTDDLLTTKKWAAGPTAVGLVQSGPWTTGALVNHLWSFAGDSDRGDINATFMQPFVAYTTRDAWTFTLQSEATYDWEQGEFAVPLNGIVSKLVNFNGQMVSFSVGARYWADPAPGGPEGFGARFTTTFLFPAR